MKRRKNNAEQNIASRKALHNHNAVETEKEFSQMNIFERNSFLKEIRRNIAPRGVKLLKCDEYHYYTGDDWEIDDANWDKMLDACGQCVKYCAEVKQKEKKPEDSDDVRKTQQVTAKTNASIIDIKKLKGFLYANKKRKVTRAEVTAFCKVSSFSIVKREIENEDDAEMLMSIIVDLRKEKVGDSELKIPGKAKKKVGEKKNAAVEKTSEVATKTTELSVVTKSSAQSESTDIFEITETSKQLVPSISVETPKTSKSPTNSAELETKTAIQKAQKTDPKHDQWEKVKAKFGLSKKTYQTTGEQQRSYTPVAKLSEIITVSKKKPVKNMIFDESILKLDMKLYQKLLQEVMGSTFKPVIWVFESQLIYLDKVKENLPVARDLLKFFAQDDNKYTKLLKGEMPKGDEFGKFCKSNDITLVSGKAPNIAWCKVNDVRVIIPNYFRNLHRSPFTGNDVIGIDSCVMGAPYMKNIFPKTKTVWIPDIQLKERSFSESEFFTVLAYYGQFGRAEIVDGHSDRSIINFYKQKGVEKAYGADYGFKVFAKLVGLPVEIVYINEEMSNASTSTMLDVIESKMGVLSENVSDLESGAIIKFDSIIEVCNGRLRIFTETNGVNISVYDSHKRPKRSPLRFIELEKYDVLVIRKGNIAIIVEVENAAKAIGKILYYGNEKNIPKNIRFAK